MLFLLKAWAQTNNVFSGILNKNRGLHFKYPLNHFKYLLNYFKYPLNHFSPATLKSWLKLCLILHILFSLYFKAQLHLQLLKQKTLSPYPLSACLIQDKLSMPLMNTEVIELLRHDLVLFYDLPNLLL